MGFGVEEGGAAGSEPGHLASQPWCEMERGEQGGRRRVAGEGGEGAEGSGGGAPESGREAGDGRGRGARRTEEGTAFVADGGRAR